MPLFSQMIEHPYHALLGTILVCTAINSIAARRRRNPLGLPLPPGPKGYPIIGNLLDMPTEKAWLTYHEWSKTYGDMVYFEVLGQPFLVLDTLERTTDLLEKRSSNYSDRMRLPMLIELMGWDIDMALLPHNDWWRRHRRAFHEHFHGNVVSKYQPTQLRECRAFLQRLQHTPEDFLHHIRHTFAATIMQVTYGYSVKDSEDPYILNAEAALEGFNEAGHPGAFLVDLIPALKYVPAWFPGAGFKRKAARWRQINQEVSVRPFEMVKEQLRDGTAVPSVATALIEKLPSETDPTRADEELVAVNTASVTYLGGADTTVSAVRTFFLAMALYPEVMKKAQAELDAVVGSNRLPDFTDRPALPYITALVKETMRWHLVGNLALGHTATEDDEYNGYFIPKGTIVMGNCWSILHEPTVYKDPHEYIPDRFLKDGQLDPTVRDPNVAAFGYGRRICPGRHFSDNGLFIIIASTLAVYNIMPPLDSNGKVVKPRVEYAPGLLSYPLPFECRITPRSANTSKLIQDALDHE
ncbi:cytochrome P450 [Panaeolus papilionaceus]|nr:cytochrome P450 [Panaeolus papilionaceus]